MFNSHALSYADQNCFLGNHIEAHNMVWTLNFFCSVADKVEETLLKLGIKTVLPIVSVYTFSVSNVICQTYVFLLQAITLSWPLFGEKVPDQLFLDRCRDAE